MTSFPVVRTIPGVLRASTAVEATDVPLQCTVSVSAEAPMTATFAFHMDDYPAENVPWTVVRAALTECLSTGSSDPDVALDVFMWLEGDQLVMALTGEEGGACISLPAEAMFEFSSAAERAIPDAAPAGAVEDFLAGVLSRPVTIEERP